MEPEVYLQQAASPLTEIEAARLSGQSGIQKFYNNSTVFVTGGSGFIGKQLIEKLIRSCNIKNVYMLLRPKRTVTADERLKDILKDSVFESVKNIKPDFADRIKTIEGDISQLNLGISQENWNILAKEVDVIFHVAATTRFDERIRDATHINVRGTREALALGQACKQLKAFIYVSTAYTHAINQHEGGTLLEQFYNSPLPPDTLMKMADCVDPNVLDDMTETLLRDWPNTYTFTKAVAEELVRIKSAELPVAIVRPSIVISSYLEPSPAWLDKSCAFSASGMIIGCGLGIIHVMEVVEEVDMSMVPVDYVNNAVITAAWDVGTRQQGENETAIYNMVSSRENRVKWTNLRQHFVKLGKVYPTPLAIWNCKVFYTSSSIVYLLLSVLFHYIPAIIMDTGLTVLGKQRRFIKLYKKVDKLAYALSYFLTSFYKMDDTQLSKLRQKQSETDRTLFNFDMKSMDWQKFMIIWSLGIRKYILKDGLKDTVYARKKQFWFGIMNYVIVAVYAYLFWVILSYVFGLFL